MPESELDIVHGRWPGQARPGRELGLISTTAFFSWTARCRLWI